MVKEAPKILVVEDEEPFVRALTLKLQHAGFTVKSVDNGDDAIEVLQHTSYDAVILDLMLPGRDGFSVLAMMRGRKISTPVVVISNLSQPEDIKRAKRLGAKEFLVKPETSLARIVQYIKRIKQ